MKKPTANKRKATAIIEAAIIVPVMVLLIAIAVDCVSGIYRYHQVATLARTGARYATVHAGQFAEENSLPVVTPEDLKTNVLLPHSAGLQEDRLSVTFTWLPNGSSYPVTVIDDNGNVKENMIRVTVNYEWFPVFFFGKSLTLSSTSEMVISY
jgi:hypothetical protein